MTVNLAYKPYFHVERRKYRFRILNGSVARFFKLALVDGNLLPQPVTLLELDEQGIAWRATAARQRSRHGNGYAKTCIDCAPAAA